MGGREAKGLEDLSTGHYLEHFKQLFLQPVPRLTVDLGGLNSGSEPYRPAQGSWSPRVSAAALAISLAWLTPCWGLRCLLTEGSCADPGSSLGTGSCSSLDGPPGACSMSQAPPVQNLQCVAFTGLPRLSLTLPWAVHITGRPLFLLLEPWLRGASSWVASLWPPLSSSLGLTHLAGHQYTHEIRRKFMNSSVCEHAAAFSSFLGLYECDGQHPGLSGQDNVKQNHHQR